MDRRMQHLFNEHQQVMESLRQQMPQITQTAGRLVQGFQEGHRLYIFGNGGSAADAQHIAAELVGRFKLERAPLPAIALSTDTSALTAIGNDYGFESVFARQVKAHAQSGDMLLGISTSGNSANVVRALQQGKEIGTYNIGLTGKDGGAMRPHCDTLICVPSKNTPRIQEAHQFIYHAICQTVEQDRFGGQR